MAQIKDMAHIRVPNAYQGESVPSGSYLVWQAVSHKKPDNPVVSYYKGIKGWEYRGSFTDVILLLWPNLSALHMKDKMRNFRSDIYKYLRATGNATCTSNFSNKHEIIWWVSDEWAVEKEPVVLTHAMTPTKREKNLTPKEAGEDRAPREVESRVGGGRLIEEHKVMAEMVCEFISREANNEPITAIEMAHLLDIHPTTGRMLGRELRENGKLFTRPETMDERELRFGERVRAMPSLLYSHINPVPPRTKREVVKGYVAVFNAPVSISRDKGSLEKRVLKAVHTRWQPVKEIAARVENISDPNTRAVLKRLIDKGLVQETKTYSGASGRRISVYRLPGGVGQQARETREAALVVTKPKEEVKMGIVTPKIMDTDSLIGGIQALVENFVEQVQPRNSDYIEELERRLSDLSNENADLKAQVKKLNDVLAPLRSLLSGG